MKRSSDTRVRKLARFLTPNHWTGDGKCPCYACSDTAAEDSARRLIRVAEAAGLQVVDPDA